jgi:hypothetical protein
VVSPDQQHLLDALDGSGSDREWSAVSRLRLLPDFPELLLERYGRATRAAERASCVYHATRYSRSSAAAFDLGILALSDRSKVVRYRAALLLAWSQNRAALVPLSDLHARGRSVEDAKAAIESIVTGDPNRFVDREGSGKLTLVIA